jgi:hypothetical protein
METFKKITNFNYMPVQEGIRLSYSFSELNKDGNIISSNNKSSFIVQDEKIIQNINNILTFLEEK